MCIIVPPLCSHTTAPQKPWTADDTPLPQSRMSIVRNFGFRGRTLAFSLSAVEDVYEVRVPRMQILRTRANDRPAEPQSAVLEQSSMEGDRRALRREILKFWQGLSEHIDNLEGNFVHEHAAFHHKSLPRLPSADDAYESFDEDGLATPKGQPSELPPPAPNTPRTPRNAKPSDTFPFPGKSGGAEPQGQSDSDSVPSTFSSMSTTSSEQDSLQLLTSLRHTFQRTEQNLYIELSHTPGSSLNDVRRSFLSAAKGATKRLSAWEAKHAAGPSKLSDTVTDTEPEWWNSGCHAVPGGNIIVREDDWGSIIAFTLRYVVCSPMRNQQTKHISFSSMDYQKELSSMAINKASVAPPVPPPTPSASRPSFFTKTASSKWFTTSAPTPDPDQEGVVWHEPETYSAVISRKEHPRDPTSLLKLGLPDVLRQKALPDAPMLGIPKFATIGASVGKGIGLGTPSSAWAKPDVQVSKDEADGLMSAVDVERVDKVLHDLEAASEPGVGKSVRTMSSDGFMTSSAFVETNIRRGKASSIMSSDSDATVSASNHSITPPTPPPKDAAVDKDKKSRDSSSERSDSEPPVQPSGFATALSSALRYMMRTGDVPVLPAKHHHALLSAAGVASTIDDKPHIKYEWTIGKRLKFSCTVYYAKQFDALRRRCGIEDVFLHSLARCENWAAEGGKSKSNFWRTTDNQFIIKTLVNAWNVADL